MSNQDKLLLAKELFGRYFRENYPGPSTVIYKPDWHSPKIFHAVISCLKEAGLSTVADGDSKSVST